MNQYSRKVFCSFLSFYFLAISVYADAEVQKFQLSPPTVQGIQFLETIPEYLPENKRVIILGVNSGNISSEFMEHTQATLFQEGLFASFHDKKMQKVMNKIFGRNFKNTYPNVKIRFLKTEPTSPFLIERRHQGIHEWIYSLVVVKPTSEGQQFTLFLPYYDFEYLLTEGSFRDDKIDRVRDHIGNLIFYHEPFFATQKSKRLKRRDEGTREESIENLLLSRNLLELMKGMHQEWKTILTKPNEQYLMRYLMRLEVVLNRIEPILVDNDKKEKKILKDLKERIAKLMNIYRSQSPEQNRSYKKSKKFDDKRDKFMKYLNQKKLDDFAVLGRKVASHQKKEKLTEKQVGVLLTKIDTIRQELRQRKKLKRIPDESFLKVLQLLNQSLIQNHSLSLHKPTEKIMMLQKILRENHAYSLRWQKTLRFWKSLFEEGQFYIKNTKDWQDKLKFLTFPIKQEIGLNSVKAADTLASQWDTYDHVKVIEHLQQVEMPEREKDQLSLFNFQRDIAYYQDDAESIYPKKASQGYSKNISSDEKKILRALYGTYLVRFSKKEESRPIPQEIKRYVINHVHQHLGDHLALNALEGKITFLYGRKLEREYKNYLFSFYDQGKEEEKRINVMKVFQELRRFGKEKQIQLQTNDRGEIISLKSSLTEEAHEFKSGKEVIHYLANLHMQEMLTTRYEEQTYRYEYEPDPSSKNEKKRIVSDVTFQVGSLQEPQEESPVVIKQVTIKQRDQVKTTYYPHLIYEVLSPELPNNQASFLRAA